MEKWKVEFQNVGQHYFPQSRVECHYNLSTQHTWASTDWVGLFKVGWSSLRDYHTFVWALVPPGYKEGMPVNCCVHFQASYLPSPGTEAYQFVYVDRKGEVCAQSPHFTFSTPKPLEDLVTLEGEREGEDMLLVVPRADLLQSRLEGCLQEHAELLEAKEAAERRERERLAEARREWDRARRELEANAKTLMEKLRQSGEKMEMLERQREEALLDHEALTARIDGLLAERAENQQRITELEGDIKVLTDRGLERELELDRMKERVQKVMAQKDEEEEEGKKLQTRLEQSNGQLRSLASEFQGLRASLAQRDMQAVQLRHSLTTLTHKLNTALSKEAEREASVSEVDRLQEQLSASEHTVGSLRAELSRISAQQDDSQAELHQARLQAAQLTLQLADSGLALREGRAAWAREREALRTSAEVDKEKVQKLSAELQEKAEQLQQQRMEREKLEVELGKEKDCHRVQLSEAHRELQELKASLRVAQKEMEQQLQEKQDLMSYVRQLEQRLEAVADAKWTEAAFNSSRPESPMSECEDENPEALQPQRSVGPLDPYSVCELPTTEEPSLGAPPRLSRDATRQAVVISQPAPLTSPRRQEADILVHQSSLEGEDSGAADCKGQIPEEESALQMLNHRNTALRELTESPVW